VLSGNFQGVHNQKDEGIAFTPPLDTQSRNQILNLAWEEYHFPKSDLKQTLQTEELCETEIRLLLLVIKSRFRYQLISILNGDPH
jgi:hypothetical protein